MSHQMKRYGSQLRNKTESSWCSPPPASKLRFSLSKKKSWSHYHQNNQNERNNNDTFSSQLTRKSKSNLNVGDDHPENIAKGRELMMMAVRVCDEDEAVYAFSENIDELNDTNDNGVLTVTSDGKTLYCPERDLTNLATFSFDKIFPTDSSTATVYSNSVAALTPHVARGWSCLCNC